LKNAFVMLDERPLTVLTLGSWQWRLAFVFSIQGRI